MLSFRFIVLSYIVVLFIAFLTYGVTFFAASFDDVTQEWQKNLATTSLDILKVAVGAAIGSLTTAGGALAQLHEKNRIATSKQDT